MCSYFVAELSTFIVSHVSRRRTDHLCHRMFFHIFRHIDPNHRIFSSKLKVTTENNWFAARPSGTENIYKVYAESFESPEALDKVLAEATEVVDKALAE